MNPTFYEFINNWFDTRKGDSYDDVEKEFFYRPSGNGCHFTNSETPDTGKCLRPPEKLLDLVWNQGNSQCLAGQKERHINEKRNFFYNSFRFAPPGHDPVKPCCGQDLGSLRWQEQCWPYGTEDDERFWCVARRLCKRCYSHTQDAQAKGPDLLLKIDW